MPTGTDLHFFYLAHTPGQLAEYMRRFSLLSPYAPTGPHPSSPGYTLETIDIFRSVKYDQHFHNPPSLPPSGLPDYHIFYHVVCLWLGAGDTCPVGLVMDSPGWSGSLQDPQQNATDSDTYLLSTRLPLYLEGRAAIIENWCGGAYRDGSSSQTPVLSGVSTTVLFTQIFDGLSRQHVAVDYFSYRIFDTISSGGVTGYCQEVQTPSSPAALPVTGSDMSGVVQALRDIAGRDVQVSIGAGKYKFYSFGRER